MEGDVITLHSPQIKERCVDCFFRLNFSSSKLLLETHFWMFLGLFFNNPSFLVQIIQIFQNNFLSRDLKQKGWLLRLMQPLYWTVFRNNRQVHCCWACVQIPFLSRWALLGHSVPLRSCPGL